MRFALSIVLSFGAIACTDPVEEHTDSGPDEIDAGCPDRCRVDEEVCDQRSTGGVCDCFDVTQDAQNCGACGNSCTGEENAAMGRICFDSACVCGEDVGACDGTPESTCCGVACVDTTTDINNCGDCGVFCGFDDRPEINNSSDSCTGGACTCGAEPACAGTLTDACCLENEALPTHCANLQGSLTDCGACGVACEPPVGDRCRVGQCVCGTTKEGADPLPCPAGQECCAPGTDLAVCQAAGSCA